ncbi:hypothetical protein [Lignipirellula cremea]|uniref:Uncharacterized protein n=1 Tax=Lignipirellula cremea TaxID=2528010 RepID=A0A518DTH6_9BACT|nr:hypothetical protein [Lignipirellula cremea]QDU95098.1 hypothetical protein Pla8534_29100 [Lignipirellula cremea]
MKRTFAIRCCSTLALVAILIAGALAEDKSTRQGEPAAANAPAQATPQENPQKTARPRRAGVIPPLTEPNRAVETPGKRPDFVTETIRGRMRYVGDVLKEEFGVKVVPEASDRLLVLLSPDGQLHPIVEDLRGRAFRRDDRLMKMDLELRVRRYEGSPLVQIINMYEIDDQGDKFLVDYWCDICSIVMFEDGPCDCCQEPNRLRKQPVGDER